ncbi:phosphatidylserine/phosphatidylglycerophosphate/cardiolipin synthase family protein [Schaalia sp. 19OD2882]|uniref:phospholipase D-like domain-containing protein n=1 Tax=Schaalia sp. 19OD2882 TaxID=2794089 RepID=UPI001C1EFFF6|nr:phospholipase D-like domain-containing protein [Schaalia sp. 19OD2882]QWW19130.1 phosphatidylserine/phosphatidylglycerophosphate/cardiolipin synthase family protein [Schaalia sp. 19OD2882]
MKWRPSAILSPRAITVVKNAGKALVAAQVAALVTVHLVDHVRKQRVPGGRHGFPTLPPADTPIAHNVVRTYTEGHSLYADMLAEIESAKKYVYFETFIWRSDEWGQRFKDALVAAARRGVEVHAIYDGFAVLNQRLAFYSFPDLPHLHILRFPVFRPGMLTLNLRRTGRDHRKILVVDGAVGFVGGYNIGNPFANEWRDTHVRVSGDAVWELENGFIDFWNHFRKRHHPVLADIGAKQWAAEVTAAFNMPNRILYPVRGLYVDAIERATHHVLITQAYFIPDREILGALKAAAGRGVRVKVLIPEFSNHILADWVARPYYGELLREGIEIWLYQHAMVHSKTMTVDGVWSTVGTANIDRLSLMGNYEVNMQFFSPELAARMEQVFDNDLTTARRLTIEEWDARSWATRILEQLVQPFQVVV